MFVEQNQITFEFTRPEVEKVVHEGVLPCRLGRILRLSKRENADSAFQNAFKDHLLDFGPGELKRNLLHVLITYTCAQHIHHSIYVCMYVCMYVCIHMQLRIQVP